MQLLAKRLCKCTKQKQKQQEWKSSKVWSQMWFHGNVLNRFLNSQTLLDQGFFFTLQLIEGLVIQFCKHKYQHFFLFFPVNYLRLLTDPSIYFSILRILQEYCNWFFFTTSTICLHLGQINSFFLIQREIEMAVKYISCLCCRYEDFFRILVGCLVFKH